VRRASRTMKRQEKELVASEMLAAVGEMASAVAHSLRNPLASVRSSAELALAAGAEGRARAAMKDILADTDRLETWIKQYLADAQPGARNDAVADVADAIRQTVDNLDRAFRRNGIHATVEIDPDLPGVRPSTLLLAQVLNGLVANAIEAMPEGGELRLAATTERHGELVRISIEDSGAGLPETGAEAAFEPFSTTKSAGFGLGLPLARRIVARYGGRLTLANRPTRGAVADLLLPAAA